MTKKIDCHENPSGFSRNDGIISPSLAEGARGRVSYPNTHKRSIQNPNPCHTEGIARSISKSKKINRDISRLRAQYDKNSTIVSSLDSLDSKLRGTSSQLRSSELARKREWDAAMEAKSIIYALQCGLPRFCYAKSRNDTHPLLSLRESRLLLKRLDSWQSITKKLQKALFGNLGLWIATQVLRLARNDGVFIILKHKQSISKI